MFVKGTVLYRTCNEQTLIEQCANKARQGNLWRKRWIILDLRDIDRHQSLHTNVVDIRDISDHVGAGGDHEAPSMG